MNTTLSSTKNLQVGGSFVFAAIVVIVLAVAAQTWVSRIKANPHSMLHGQDAVDTGRCLDGEGDVIGMFYSPKLNNNATLCEMDGKFFVLITIGAVLIVTAFCRSAAKTAKDAIRYQKDNGYK